MSGEASRSRSAATESPLVGIIGRRHQSKPLIKQPRRHSLLDLAARRPFQLYLRLALRSLCGLKNYYKLALMKPKSASHHRHLYENFWLFLSFMCTFCSLNGHRFACFSSSSLFKSRDIDFLWSSANRSDCLLFVDRYCFCQRSFQRSFR